MSKKYKAVLAIDFDKTIVDSDYPEIHGLRKDAELISKLYDNDFFIIVNTCRSGDQEKTCKEFLDDNYIKFHLINENHPLLIDYFNSDSRKISADIYIDDKCIFSIANKELFDWDYLYSLIEDITSNPNFKSILSHIYES